MQTLERRVKQRMASEKRQLRSEQMALARRRDKLRKQAETALDAQRRYLQLLGNGERTGPVTRLAARGLRKLGSLERQMIKLNTSMAEISSKLEKLDVQGELDRRLSLAKTLGGGDKPLTGIEAVEAVILYNGKPTRYDEATDLLLESGTVRLAGKTPEQTISSYLAREAAKPDGKFVRVAPGLFDVRKRKKTKAAS